MFSVFGVEDHWEKEVYLEPVNSDLGGAFPLCEGKIVELKYVMVLEEHKFCS